MSESLTVRLNKILPRVISDDFLSGSGIGNEIAFYIFDYPPEDELRVREHVAHLLEHIPRQKPGLRVKHVNLFEFVLDHLSRRKLLDKAIKMQGDKGDGPLLRAHTLLNNLHTVMGQTPLVLFYPGRYDGQSLRLFGKMRNNNYYRAFKLVP